jgi:arylsulfatase A-like enzyme
VIIELEGQAPELLYMHQTDNMSPVAQAWRDIELPLSKYAGREVRLRFQASPTMWMRFEDAPFAPPKPLVSAPLIVASEAPDEQRRNVILISIDTLRADHLGAYGYQRPVSPTIDHLVQHGVLFENVIAQWPETSASHMTMFTGLYPSVHGIGILRWGAAVLPAWQFTVAEVFRRAGFVTGAITEDGLVLASAGFTRGFEQYREFPLRTARGPDTARNPIDQFPVARGHLGEAKQVFATGAAWVQQHRRDRFFLFLHTYQVHQRSAPGERYAALRASFVGDHVLPGITDARNFVATYDAAIAYTDEALKELLHALDELDLTRRTLVIITSDHGEEFYEHGTFGHGDTLYDPALHVPLIFYAPGFVAAGKRVSTELGLIDLAPTIVDLLKLPSLQQFQGHSAAGLINGKADGRRGPVISELGDTWRALRTNSWKLIRVAAKDTPRVEFYDLHQDPGETRRLDVQGNPNALEALQLLTQHGLECRALRDRLQAASASHVVTRAADLDEETRERLEALGYKVPSSR